jgi:methionyl-tRNA formyltransferase
VSIQTLEKRRFDTGRIVAQHVERFPPSTRAPDPGFLDIEPVMADRAATLVLSLLQDLPAHWRASWPQSDAEKSFAPKLKPAHSVIRWQTMSAANIVARDRAFSYLVSLPTASAHRPLAHIPRPPPQYRLSTTLIPARPGFPPLPTTLADTTAVRTQDLHHQCPATHAALIDAPPGTAVYSERLSALICRTQQPEDGFLAVRSLQSKGKKNKPAADWWAAYADRASPAKTLYFQ